MQAAELARNDQRAALPALYAALGEIPGLVEELRAARVRIAAVKEILAGSPVGPTRDEACRTLFDIRLAVTS